MVRRELQAAYPHLKANIEVIHNGVDTERFIPNAELQKYLSDKVFCFVGHDQEKGLSQTLEICKSYLNRHGKSSLLVAGKGDPGAYSGLIEHSGLRIAEFMGVVDDVERVYQSSDFLILPTDYDPASNACLEALACGCGVVSTAHNGSSELLNTSTGRVIDVDDGNRVLDFLHSGIEVDDALEIARAQSISQEGERISDLVRHSLKT